MNRNIEKRNHDSVVEKAAKIYVAKFEFGIFVVVVIIIGLALASIFDQF
jgi:hypothetical protein